MFNLPILGFAFTISFLVVAGVAAMLGGMFIGSQIDDRLDRPSNPIAEPDPTYIKWPLLIGGLVFVIIVAKTLAKKVFK